jgi:co-chaperonin GroES (HSP10)
MKFKLFGERVLVEKVNPKQGTILIPETAMDSNLYKIGRAVAVGDGVWKGEQRKMHIAPDDLVYFQINAVIAAHCCFEMIKPGGKNVSLINLDQKDCVAKLDSNDVGLSGFHPLGSWVLLRPFKRTLETSLIVLPNTHEDWQFMYYRIEKIGTGCKMPLQPGQEVVLVHGHAHPIMLGSEEMAYISEDDIHGIVTNDEPVANGKPDEAKVLQE